MLGKRQPLLMGVAQVLVPDGLGPRNQQVVWAENFHGRCRLNRCPTRQGAYRIHAHFLEFPDVVVAAKTLVAHHDVAGFERPRLLPQKPQLTVLDRADAMAQQRPGLQAEAGTDAGLREAAAGLLASRLGPCLLVAGRIGHAHARSIDHDDASALPSAIAAPLLQLFGRVLQDALEPIAVQLASCLALRRCRCRRQGHGPSASKCLYLADHFLATAVGVENLGEKGPESVLSAEYPPPTEVALRLAPQLVDRDEGTKTIAQLTDRVVANSMLFVSQLLRARSGLAAQGGQVKSREKQGAVVHAKLSHLR